MWSRWVGRECPKTLWFVAPGVGFGTRKMSEPFTSRGQALVWLLHHTAGSRKPPAKTLYDLSWLLAAEGRFDDSADIYRKAFLQLPMLRPTLDDEPGLSPIVRAEHLRKQAQALIDR